MELMIRSLAGDVVVSFSVIDGALKPKRFAGFSRVVLKHRILWVGLWVLVIDVSGAHVRGAVHRHEDAHATVPNSDPTPAVTAIARAPQNVTRKAPTITPAPPARAANPPRSARNTSEVPATKGMTLAGEATIVTKRGMTAPTAKLPADANAA